MFSRQAELTRREPELVNAVTYQFVSIFFGVGVFFGLFLFICVQVVLASILVLSIIPISYDTDETRFLVPSPFFLEFVFQMDLMLLDVVREDDELFS